MPRTTTKSAISGKSAQPKISAKLLEELIPGPVTKEEFKDIFQNFKKAFIERALNAEMSHHPHTAYLFANQRGNRIKVLVHDGIGIWLAARRLHQGKFVWVALGSANCQLERVQLDALVLGLPWTRIASAASITMV
jgi:transposase